MPNKLKKGPAQNRDYFPPADIRDNDIETRGTVFLTDTVAHAARDMHRGKYEGAS